MYRDLVGKENGTLHEIHQLRVQSVFCGLLEFKRLLPSKPCQVNTYVLLPRII